MSPKNSLKSARLKVKRAETFATEVRHLLKNRPPFLLFIETDARVGTRTIVVEAQDSDLEALSLAFGDFVHNLRSALDHAFAEVLRQTAPDIANNKAIQFPFSSTEESFEDACRSRYAHKAGSDFLSAIGRLRPFGGTDGNPHLYAIHRLDIPDKHTRLISFSSNLSLDAETLRRSIPDFPHSISGNISIVGVTKPIIWEIMPFTMHEWIINRVPKSGVFRDEVKLPVDTALGFADDFALPNLSVALANLSSAARTAIMVLEEFSQ